MRIAAIDIGSNAIRLQVSTVIQTRGQLTFKKLEYLRFPLRLGQDVFNTGTISRIKKTKFKKLMKAFKLLLDLYEVDDYMACATSAMREATNGQEIAAEVLDECGMKIQIINGQREALLINNVILSFLDKKKNYLHIDVGGGSTELNLYRKGEKTATQSFKIGSVRRLDHHDSPVIWKNMKKWVVQHTQDAHPLTAAGTGGNINKLFEMAGKMTGDRLALGKVKELTTMIRELSLEDRINNLQLNPDRADVIIPAAEIYISVMEWAGARFIIVPDVGLKDGIMQFLFEKNVKTGATRFR
jgi:exopolyphosphatase / guanosine-5'-triphosphate,3'-diphosphate pyrophosphatase